MNIDRVVAYEMGVDPSFRRRGVGTALVAALQEVVPSHWRRGARTQRHAHLDL